LITFNPIADDFNDVTGTEITESPLMFPFVADNSWNTNDTPFYWPGNINSTITTMVSAGVTLNAAWHTAVALLQCVFWPDYLLPDLMNDAQDINLGVNTSQLWKKIDKPQLGGPALFAVGEYVQQTVLVLTSGGTGLDITVRRPISMIGSSVFLGDADLVMAGFLAPLSYSISSIDVSPRVRDYPFSYAFDGFSAGPAHMLGVALRPFYQSRAAVSESKTTTRQLKVGQSSVAVGGASSFFTTGWRSLLEGAAGGLSTYAESLSKSAIEKIKEYANSGTYYLLGQATSALGSYIGGVAAKGRLPSSRLLSITEL